VVHAASGSDVPASMVLASLSLATDLGTGQAPGHALRTCLRSVEMARHLGLDEDAVREIHQVALLRFLGCSSDASETAAMAGGDNLAFVSGMAPVVMGSQREQVRGLVRSIAPDLPPLRRAGRVAAALAEPGGAARSLSTHCEVAARLGSRMGLLPGTVEARWDGKGFPAGLRGADIPVAVRIVTVARDVELLGRVAPDEARSILRARRGRAYDPSVVDAALAGDAITGEHPAEDRLVRVWDAVLAAEPEPVVGFAAGQVDRVLEAMADFADLYTPWTRGRSPRVAEVARHAGRACGLSGAEAHTVWRSALVADVGRVAVPAGVWNHPGSLGVDAWEQVRLHSYWSERVLARCPPLQPLARLAGGHHERGDGSGYHRGSDASSQPTAARVLAALSEDRPHRRALDADTATAALAEEVRSGRLDAEAVDAVCRAAGHSVSTPRRAWPRGLTDREVDVLRLIARGRTNKEVAAQLHLSPKTVGRHVENLYAKAGVSSRAAAALFAMEERLL
jgi:HD-GYP domain-containing protein (c-di-GMP phosphodiesterase class II)/DNA-binding CsgD family transcriptional regulator